MDIEIYVDEMEAIQELINSDEYNTAGEDFEPTAEDLDAMEFGDGDESGRYDDYFAEFDY